MQDSYSVEAPQTPPAPYPWWLSLILFVGLYALMQWGWESARGTALERMVVDHATVDVAAAAIRVITPEIPAQGVGAKVQAPGGGLNVLRGCEGTEVLFLLLAALVAHRLHWRVRLAGLMLGVPLVFVLNEIRLVFLFYAFRSDKALFDQLHGLIAPAALVAMVILFFLALLRWNERHWSRQAAPGALEGAA